MNDRKNDRIERISNRTNYQIINWITIEFTIWHDPPSISTKEQSGTNRNGVQTHRLGWINTDYRTQNAAVSNGSNQKPQETI